MNLYAQMISKAQAAWRRPDGCGSSRFSGRGENDRYTGLAAYQASWTT